MGEVTEVFVDERSRAIWEGKRARVSTGPTPGAPAAVNVPANSGLTARAAAMIEYIAARFDQMRGMAAEQAARTIGIDVRTLQRWRHEDGALRRALPQRPVAFVERLVCLLAPPPVAPALPVTIVMRRPRPRPRAEACPDVWVDGSPRLEMRAPHDVLRQLAAWVRLAVPGVELSGNNVRLYVRADLKTLARIRADLMHLERWQTCTPSAADVDEWLGGGGEA